MLGVSRPPIWPYVQAVASRLDYTFVAVMAWLAQGLKRTGPKVRPVPTVRLDVIDHGGRAYPTLPCTAGAQRMIEKLAHAQALPDCAVVPMVPRGMIAIVLGHDRTADVSRDRGGARPTGRTPDRAPSACPISARGKTELDAPQAVASEHGSGPVERANLDAPGCRSNVSLATAFRARKANPFERRAEAKDQRAARRSRDRRTTKLR